MGISITTKEITSCLMIYIISLMSVTNYLMIHIISLMLLTNYPMIHIISLMSVTSTLMLNITNMMSVQSNPGTMPVSTSQGIVERSLSLMAISNITKKTRVNS